ncbi:MAG: hypothetical protein U0797_07280 [Gemmataceae bacterium]
MRYLFHAGSAAVAVVLLVNTTFAADELKSGAQKPSTQIRAFNPLHCSGSGEGTKACLV